MKLHLRFPCLSHISVPVGVRKGIKVDTLDLQDSNKAVCTLTFLTTDLRVARVSLRAVAERRVLEDPAVRVPAAVARVHAVPVQARLLLRALAVGLAPHDDGGS